MKKQLLGTSALIAVGLMAGHANAADKLSLGVGGFIEEWFGYTQKDSEKGNARDYEGGQFGVMTDAEIHFKGTLNLDNGMKLTARVELETNADRQNVSVDEVWLQISSDSLGMIEIGEQDGYARRNEFTAFLGLPAPIDAPPTTRDALASPNSLPRPASPPARVPPSAAPFPA